MDKLEQVKQELVKEWTPALVESFKTLLRSWLIQHVIKEDLLMKPYLTKWSPEFDPR
jgi:hemerythrin